MNQLVEWQIRDKYDIVYPWWTHPFLEVLETWDLKDKNWLEFGGGHSTIWLRSRCKWVDTIETDQKWIGDILTVCDAYKRDNGAIFHPTNAAVEGKELGAEYLSYVPQDKIYDIISVDGIYRTETLEWAVEYGRRHGVTIVIDNLDQDYVWISPRAMKAIEPYEVHTFVQPNHTNHEGKPWNTRYLRVEKEV